MIVKIGKTRHVEKHSSDFGREENFQDKKNH